MTHAEPGDARSGTTSALQLVRGDYRAGALAGTVAGAVMAVFMMGLMAARGRSVWTNPDLIAVMWLGPAVADGERTAATLVGLATHMATSALIGLVSMPFIAGLPRGRTLLASVSYAVASYPVVFAAVLSWANPLMVARAELVPMSVAHTLFGLVMGFTYLRLGASRSPATPPATSIPTHS